MASQAVKLSNGREMPFIGLGTWKSEPNQVRDAVEAAIDCGYKHIDCAAIYRNEDEVGDGLQAKLKDGTIKREDIFITSKLWSSYHAKEKVKEGLLKTLKDLKLDYLDLYLIHWPMAVKYDENDLFPKDADGKAISADIDYVETWQAMEALVDEGLVKGIGLSNFNIEQAKRVLASCKHRPVVAQFEIHPFIEVSDMINFYQSEGIAVTGYSPFCSPDRPAIFKTENEPSVFENEVIKGIAEKHKKSAAQTVLRFLIQRNIIAIPKSVTPSRIKANLEVFDFNLTEDEMNEILKLSSLNFRACNPPMMKSLKYYPY